MTSTDIKEVVKNPKLYYILVPCLAALWPLWTGLISMSDSNAQWHRHTGAYLEAQKIMLSIKDLDPDRLAAKNMSQEQFSYPAVVDSVARSAGISSADYKLHASAIMKVTGGQESQDADITLKQVDLSRFAKFLTSMQMQGASLQCVSLKLTKQKGTADTWKADMKFRYYKS